MAIAKMHHFKLYSMKSLTGEMLTFLQEYGDVHIRNLTEEVELLEFGLEYLSEPKEILDIRYELDQLEDIINLLSVHADSSGLLENMKRGNKNYTYKELMEKGSEIDLKNVSKEIKELQRLAEEKHNQIDKIIHEIDELKPWIGLKMSAADLVNTKNVEFNTGYILTPQFNSFLADIKDLKYTVIEEIGPYENNTYFLIVTTKEDKTKLIEILRKYSYFEDEPKVKTTAVQEIKTKEEEVSQLKAEIEDIKKSFKSYVEFLDDVKLRYEYLNQVNRKLASTDKLMSTRMVNYIDGYIESEKAEDFEKSLEAKFPNECYLEIQPANEDDEHVPIVLKNNKFVSAFENLTEMYALPKYNELDPTPFLAPFYWLFFGMMIGDFGYGVLIFLGTKFILSFNLSDSMRKTMNFFYYLGYSTMLWGLIYGSIFGGIVPMPALIDPAVDYNTVMVVAIILGGIHMFTGLALQGYMLIKNASVLDAVYDVLTWFMALFGAIYLGLSMFLGLPGGTVAKWVMIAGMVGIVLFTGRSAGSKGAQLASGAYNLYGISSWLGDFVSYLRLMALGLAGAFIGVAVNMIVKTIAGGGSIGGIIGAAAVFIFGQILNFGLSALSAYVHALRLIFVEFFGKFYEGGGVTFESVRNETKYINIKNQED